MAVAIVLAAGSGSRMNSNVAKQYITLYDKEIVYYSLYTFQNNNNISDIILVTRDSDVDLCKTIVQKNNFSKISQIIIGGKERYNSVYNGLNALSVSDDEIVMIHDGARPFVTDQMIEDSIINARKYDACTVCVPVKDTIKISDENGFGKQTPDRRYLYQIQTPQTFKYGVIKAAYNKMLEDENHKITDDSMLVEQYSGVKTKLIQGSYENIKITTPEDIDIAKIFAKKILKKF